MPYALLVGVLVAFTAYSDIWALSVVQGARLRLMVDPLLQAFLIVFDGHYVSRASTD